MRRFLLAFLFVALPLAAQTSYVIERIDVSASRVRPAIIRAETRLVAGRAYTAEQLDQAVYRVRRLPFVVDATYALEPGSGPDARVLRVSVVDQPMFNYDFDVQGIGVRGGYAYSNTGLGLRFFPAPTGVLDLDAGGQQFSNGNGSAAGHFGDLSVQYTAYGLFGTSAYAGAGISTRYEANERLVSPMFLLGIPLTQTQTVRASYQRFGTEDENSDLLTAQWMYETTDDPYFGRRGLSIAAGPQIQKIRYHEIFNPGTRFQFTVDDRSKSTGFVVDAAKYWPWHEHSTLWVRGNQQFLKYTGVNNGRPKLDENYRYGDYLAGAGHNFDFGRGVDDFHRLRLELAVGYHLDHSSTRLFSSDRSGGEVFTGLAYRSRIGVFRLGLSYVER